MNALPSAKLNDAVDALAKLPGVGRKTALRLALYLLRRPAEESQALADAIANMRQGVRYCQLCHNISDTDLCYICASERRDHNTLCVVENVQDVLAIENTQQYNGIYHVLGGIISPIDGIGPSDIEIDTLIQRVAQGDIKEVIFALSSTMEGDTTSFYIQRKLASPNELIVSTIARGIAVGNEIEYTDEVTLGRSIINRTRV